MKIISETAVAFNMSGKFKHLQLHLQFGENIDITLSLFIVKLLFLLHTQLVMFEMEFKGYMLCFVKQYDQIQINNTNNYT